MSDQHDEDEALVLRSMAHRMSKGIEIKTRKHGLFTFHNVFLGTDASEWLIADPRSGVNDLDGAIQVGQRLIEHGYVIRVSRELKARKVRHFGHSERAKAEFRSGGTFYRFDALRISPFQLHVVVHRARQLKSMDLNGLNDPYVKLGLGSQSAVTRVQIKTNDPVWDEHFVFGVDSVDAQQLQLSVCDYDKFKRDDHIGSCKIGLSHLPCSEATYADVEGMPLSPHSGTPLSPSGSVASSSRATSALGIGSSGSRADARTDVMSDVMSDTGVEACGRRGHGRSRERSTVKHMVSWVKKKRVRHGDYEHDGDAHMGSGQPGYHGNLTFYRLLASKEKRLAKEDMRVDAEVGDAGFAKPSAGELACDIWLTSFQPKPLPVQGEAKFSLRCRIWEMCGVTSSEERNLGELNSSVIRQKAVLMMYGDRVSSSSSDRNKDKERKTSFKGSLISLDFRANMATDMLKFVVQQKTGAVDLYKPVATVSIPLRGIPVTFPQCDGSDADSQCAAEAAAAATAEASSNGGKGTTAGGIARRLSLVVGSGKSNGDRSCGGANGGKGEAGRAPWSSASGEPRARRYRLQTLAGPMTTRTMDNGYVVMSLTLVPNSGNDLLGEKDPRDGDDVKVSPPSPPPPLATPVLDVPLSCGYQRLRKALLWNDSKLQAAFCDLLNYSEITHSPWLDREGGAGNQENLTGCTRERTFVIPKSAIVAASKTEAYDVILADGPSFMAYEARNRTPGVSFGDKFEVAIQFVLIKEGPEKCRLKTSAEAVFREKLMGLVQGQIVSAVSKVTKDNHQQLVGLIEEALSGGAGGGAMGRGRGRRKRGRKSLCCLPLIVLVLLMAGAGFMLNWEAFAMEKILDDSPLHRRLSLGLFGSGAGNEDEKYFTPHAEALAGVGGEGGDGSGGGRPAAVDVSGDDPCENQEGNDEEKEVCDEQGTIARSCSS